MESNRVEIAPALLCMTLLEFMHELKLIEHHVRRAQVDIMDGRFVPNTTVHPKDLRHIKTPVKLEMQLMVKDPTEYLSDCCRMGAWMVIFHYESYKNAKKIISFINQARTHKLKVGIAINPSTPAAKIKQFLKLVDLALVMTVKPGFGGQKFIPATLQKVRQIRRWAPHMDIEVDGGIHATTAPLAVKAGANVLVAGSEIFAARTVKEGLEHLKATFK